MLTRNVNITTSSLFEETAKRKSTQKLKMRCKKANINIKENCVAKREEENSRKYKRMIHIKIILSSFKFN